MEKSFGKFLKEKRLEKHLTQKELAKALFVTESAISKWEKNIAHPDITQLPRLSEILEVTEHELITASIDKETREEKVQAKKWRHLTFSWNLFFYIAYGITILTCFICNLAVNGTLSWFWIVLSALALGFSFTNLPNIIKKHKLILIPLSMFLALCLLLGVCCIYTHGNWFLIPVLSVFLGLAIIFTPIYISKYEIFNKIKKYNDFVSVFIDFCILNLLLIVINIYTIVNYSSNLWYFSLALPIALAVYIFLNLLMSVRFLKINKFLKTSIIFLLIDVLYLFIPFINSKNPNTQQELEQINIFKANFTNWQPEISLENNIHCIVFLSILALVLIFSTIGFIRLCKNNHKKI